MKSKGRGAFGLAAGVIAAGIGAGGCTTGSGSGTATGTMWILGCGNEGEPFGVVDDSVYPPVVTAADYTLRPTFFAAEPIEDTSSGYPINRLVIRMQHDGRGIEVNDTLYFDVINSYEVARCIRGRTVNGVNDWLPDSSVLDFRGVPLAGQTIDGVTIPTWCDWSAGGEYPRIYLHPDGLVRSSLVPLKTCPIPPRGATTGGQRVTAGAQAGWVDFRSFGNVSQPSLPPDMRAALPTDFTVAFDTQLSADFSVQLIDQRNIAAPRINEPQPVVQHLDGALDGFFDFDFVRGRASQGFP